MGAEAKCRVTVGSRKADGKALLETDELIFRGDHLRLAIPYQSIRQVEVSDGTLRVTSTAGVAAFDLGDAAAAWAQRIRNPRSRIDKLGIKAGQRVLLVGVRHDSLRDEIEARGATVAVRATGQTDVIFIAADDRRDLERLVALKTLLKPDGAIWVIRPKGSPDISEAEVMKAGKAAGLVDVKVVRFSEAHTAEKFVIPLAKR